MADGRHKLTENRFDTILVSSAKAELGFEAPVTLPVTYGKLR